MARSLSLLSLIIYIIIGSGPVNDWLAGNKSLPPPCVMQPDLLIRRRANKTPLGRSLPRRSKRQRRKNSFESTGMCSWPMRATQ